MRIKRTYAATMREALALVKQEQGPDAVILGNKKVPGGVEILSAIDFDHQRADAYTGNSALPVSAPARVQPAAVKKVSRQVEAALSDLSAMPDFIFEQTADSRREPVLGVSRHQHQAHSLRAVEKPSIPVAAKPPQAPVKKPQSVSEYSKTEVSLRRKMLPVEEEVKFRETETDQLDDDFEDDSQFNEQSAYNQSRQHYSSSPVIDEVKDELKNLRNLMQSQLSVLDWDRYSDLHPVRTVLLNLMTELGLGTDICEMVFTELGQFSDDPHKVWQQALGVLAKSIPIATTDILTSGGRIALVGSTGVGKTTTIAKLAARFAHSHGKHSVALITTDNFRVGAQEQLQHFARMLEVPLLTASSSEELTDRLRMLSDKKLVLIDTAGMSQSDVRLSEQFHKLQTGSPEIQPYLVLSANTQLAALNETIRNFQKVKLAGGIITKLDESGSLPLCQDSCRPK